MSQQDEFELPDDITQLDDDKLDTLLEGAVRAFDAQSNADAVTADDLERLRRLATAVQDIRNEQAARVEAAQKAAAEIEALAAQVRGDNGSADTDEPAEADGAGDDAGSDTGSDAGDTASGDTADSDGDATASSSGGETSTAVVASAHRPALNLSRVRSRQPRVLPEPPKPGLEITASVDVPGLVPGQSMDLTDVPKAIISRANALKTAGGGTGLVISYRHPTPQDLTVTDSSSAPEGTTVVMAAGNQRRLPQGDLVASGGWCAPSETLYDIVDISCPEMLWDAPEIELSRGGIRYFLTPPLDVAQLTWIHTEADDISGAEKPCYVIPCPEPVEVRCDAVGVCLQAGILTQRHFPELVNWYLRNAMVALEIRIRQALLQQLLNSPMTTQITIPETFGAVSAVYAAVALQAADMIERYSLCDRISLEVVFPWWARNLFLTDLARRNGVDVCDLDPGCIQDLFSTLGVRVQFARGLSPAVPDEIGGETPATQWPTELQFVIYPAGQVLIGRGESVDLGVIHDSTKFRTNDYTALFAETCVALVQRMEARAVTVPICPSGETGAQTVLACAES